MSDELDQLETLRQQIAAQLGHRIGDDALLRQACTHASCSDPNASEHERLAQHNERMEFLGDALLGAAIVALLYERHPDASEGTMSRLRSHLVSRRTLAAAIDDSGLLPHCFISSHLQQPWPHSVKANLAEGILGAIYLDGGWPALQQAVPRLLAQALADSADEDTPGDAKNQLQTWSLKHFRKLPSYESRREGGSDHEPHFVCTVSIDAYQVSAGGSSKRRSEAAAARKLLEQLEQQDS